MVNLLDRHIVSWINFADNNINLSMNELVSVVDKSLNKKIPAIRVPYFLGMFGGYCFDALAWLSSKKLSISSVRQLLVNVCRVRKQDRTGYFFKNE